MILNWWEGASFDVGTVQHDSLGSNAAATLAAWHDKDWENKARFAAPETIPTETVPGAANAARIIADLYHSL